MVASRRPGEATRAASPGLTRRGGAVGVAEHGEPAAANRAPGVTALDDAVAATHGLVVETCRLLCLERADGREADALSTAPEQAAVAEHARTGAVLGRFLGTDHGRRGDDHVVLAAGDRGAAGDGESKKKQSHAKSSMKGKLNRPHCLDRKPICQDRLPSQPETSASRERRPPSTL
jgi:hypothetical protein